MKFTLEEIKSPVPGKSVQHRLRIQLVLKKNVLMPVTNLSQVIDPHINYYNDRSLKIDENLEMKTLND